MKLALPILMSISMLLHCAGLTGQIESPIDSAIVKHPENISPLSIEEKANFFNHIGIASFYGGDYDSSRLYWLETIRLMEYYLSSSDIKLANSFNNLGNAYQKLWLFENAIDFFDRAQSIYAKIDSNHSGLSIIYLNKAIIYKKLNNYNKSNEYLNFVIDYLNKQVYINYDLLSRAYLLQSRNAFALGNLKKGYNLYEKSFFLQRGKNITDTINHLNEKAILKIRLGKYNESSEIYSLLLDYLKKSNIVGSVVPKTYMNLALFVFEKLNNPDSALNLYNHALEKYILYNGFNDRRTGLCFGNIGEIYEYKGDYERALINYQRAINSLLDLDYSDTNFYRQLNPNPNKYTLITYYLKKKANSLNHLYSLSYNIRDLTTSHTLYKQTIDIIDSIRVNFDAEESKVILSSEENLTYKNAINVGYRLYQVTSDREYLNDCYSFLEKSKSYSLLSSIRDLEAKEFGNIPPHLLREESELYKKIAAHKEWVFEEEKRRYPDRAKIETWERNLFRLNQQYERLLNQFELEYPAYYNLKYDTRVITPAELQEKLRPNETLLEYSVQDSMIYIFAITKAAFEVKQVKVDSSFYRDIEFLVHHVGRKDFSFDVGEIYRGYKKSAHHLYTVLLEPVAGMIEGQTLVVIPDGQLSYIPFGALLTDNLPADRIDYRHLPYVVLDHIIGYSYSATLQYDIQRNIEEPKKLLLAFAPSYENISIRGRQSDPEYMKDYRGQLVPITGILDEVKGITRILNGDYFLEEEATETRFKKLAGEYKILHLAMHTLVNDEDPMYSKLAFALDVDESNDGFLNTYEIYNMRYNASLAVLSSCESGFGKLQTGEGVMSLARAFMYAGCPSIVMTLWEVSDKTGADLMEGFYKYLKKGYSKPEALQKAKINFIQRSDNLKANPYFWSAYVNIGDPRPIFKQEINPWGYLIVLILLFGGSLALIFRRRPRKKVTRY